MRGSACRGISPPTGWRTRLPRLSSLHQSGALRLVPLGWRARLSHRLDVCRASSCRRMSSKDNVTELRLRLGAILVGSAGDAGPGLPSDASSSGTRGRVSLAYSRSSRVLRRALDHREHYEAQASDWRSGARCPRGGRSVVRNTLRDVLWLDSFLDSPGLPMSSLRTRWRGAITDTPTSFVSDCRPARASAPAGEVARRGSGG